MRKWLLSVESAPNRGSWNMAVDEYLFSMAEKNPPLTVLRFYRWLRPTASLGFYQDASKVVDAAFCAEHGIDIVRRLTGGKLVLHDKEVTYSVVSSDTELFTETLRGSYRMISQALLKGLELMGVKAAMAGSAPAAYARSNMPCFAYPARDEIEAGGRKIVGSAQKRTGGVFLQHGSIPMEGSFDLLAGAAGSTRDGLSSGAGMTSISEELGRPVDFDWAVERFVSGFAGSFGVSFDPFLPSAGDLAAIETLEKERYAAPQWTLSKGPAER